MGTPGGEPDAIREQYAREAARYDRRWASYLAATLEPTLEVLAPRAGERVLDVGCGTGLLLERLLAREPEVAASGVDLSADMLRLARQRLPARVALVQGDVHRLPFESASFDAAVSSSALHHWPDPLRALREIARVTRPGGRLVVTDWCDDFLVTRLFSRLLRLWDASHHRSLRSAELTALLSEAGWRVERVHRYRQGPKWGFMTVHARRGPDG